MAIPYTPIPYAPSSSYALDLSVGDIIRRRGAREAESARRLGAISAEGWSNVAALIGASIDQVTRNRETKMAALAEAQKVQLAREKERNDTGLALLKLQSEEANRAAERDWKQQEFGDRTAVARVNAMTPGAEITPESYQRDFSTPSVFSRFQEQPAVPTLPARDLPGSPFTAPTVSPEPGVGRPGAYVLQPTEQQRMARQTAERAAQAAKDAEANRTRDDQRATEAAAATERYRSAMLARPTAASISLNMGNQGDFTQEGDAFLKSVPAKYRNLVKKIGDYDEPITNIQARGGERTMIQSWVNQYNPNFNQNDYTLITPTRKAFTSGTQGQAINALNTATLHLSALTPLLEGLGNGSFQLTNDAKQRLSALFGSEAPTNFDALKELLAAELDRSFSGGTATISGREAQKQQMAKYQSPAQLAGYLKTMVPAMGAKLYSYEQQYRQAVPRDTRWSPVFPAVRSVLDAYGYNAADPLAHAAPAPKKNPYLK